MSNSSDNTVIADFFRRNGIDTVQEELKVLDSISCKIPSSLWEHVALTRGQLEELQRLYGYK